MALKKLNIKNINPTKVVPALSLIVIGFLTVAFAAFSNNLAINDIGATVRIQEIIRVTGVSAMNPVSNATSNYEDYNVNTTVKFLEKAIRFYAPAFSIELIQMDNGSEFTNNQIHVDRKKEPPLALPEKWLIKQGIGFRHIPPSSPHLNGRIERPHGVDKWRYPRMTSGSHRIEELKEFCEEDCLDYNTYRPHSMLNYLTPVEFLQSLPGYENACPDFSVLY